MLRDSCQGLIDSFDKSLCIVHCIIFEAVNLLFQLLPKGVNTFFIKSIYQPGISIQQPQGAIDGGLINTTPRTCQDEAEQFIEFCFINHSYHLFLSQDDQTRGPDTGTVLASHSRLRRDAGTRGRFSRLTLVSQRDAGTVLASHTAAI
jgi:hypothetical protein